MGTNRTTIQEGHHYITQPTPADFDSKVTIPFLNTMVDYIRQRITDSNSIDQLTILDLTGTNHLQTMYG